MSWDIFVQDIPKEAKSVEDIPVGFKPRSLQLKRAEVIALIKEIAPFADFSDPSWGHIDSEHTNIEVSLGDSEVMDGFAFHVRGGDLSPMVIAEILERLGVRAFDAGGSETGIFDPATARKNMAAWERYRDHVTGRKTDVRGAQ